MNYQITINFADGVTPDTVAKAMKAAHDAIATQLGGEFRLTAGYADPERLDPLKIDRIIGGSFAEIYASEITKL